MKGSVRDQLNGIHPQMLRVQSEPDPQLLGRRVIGQAIELALARSCLTKQEAAYAMGYTDSGVMGRWIQGTETPQFAKLWAISAIFRQELVVALAQTAGLETETVVRVKRTA